MKLKLFVWTGFQPDWTDSLAFAIAENEEQARQLVCEKYGWGTPNNWGTLQVLPLDTPVAFCESGGS